MASHGQNDARRIEPTLRQLPQNIAASIRRTTDEDVLRRFACACSRSALTACNMDEPFLLDALGAALTIDTQQPDQIGCLRQEVAERVEHLDEQAFEAQEAADQGISSRDTYESAFRAARAATSVLHALEQPAALAAAEACYEAFHAIDELQAEKALLDIARRALGRSAVAQDH